MIMLFPCYDSSDKLNFSRRLKQLLSLPWRECTQFWSPHTKKKKKIYIYYAVYPYTIYEIGVIIRILQMRKKNPERLNSHWVLWLISGRAEILLPIKQSLCINSYVVWDIHSHVWTAPLLNQPSALLWRPFQPGVALGELKITSMCSLTSPFLSNIRSCQCWSPGMSVAGKTVHMYTARTSTNLTTSTLRDWQPQPLKKAWGNYFQQCQSFHLPFHAGVRERWEMAICCSLSQS